jgi:hypothetical protein
MATTVFMIAFAAANKCGSKPRSACTVTLPNNTIAAKMIAEKTRIIRPAFLSFF